MKYIVRTIPQTKVSVSRFTDGEMVEMPSMIIEGAVKDEARIDKAVRKAHKGVSNVVVTSFEIIEKKYRLPVETFLRWAELTDSDSEEGE